MEDSEVYRLLEGRVTYATETNGHKIYYVLPHEPEESQNAEAGLREGLRLFHIGRPAHPPTSTRCVLLLGETGAGKTTLVNAQLNYLYGVKFDDPFRLQVEERTGDGRLKTDGCTDVITVYTVHYREGMKHAYNFVLIDTPGLGDTRGAEQQQLIMRRLKDLFMSEFGVDDLHCLAIVTKGNTNRRTEHQRNLLAEITTLLGRYVPDITHVFATHALESMVSAEAVVRDCGITPMGTFKFDNGSLLCPKETDEAWDPRRRWKIMTEQYDDFFGALIAAPAVSIEILRERKLFDTCKKNLKEQVELLATVMVTHNDTIKTFEKYEALEEKNKDWKTTEVIEITVEEVLESGTHAHNCIRCKLTCETCSKRTCKVILPSPANTAVTAGSVVGSVAGAPVAEAITASSAKALAAVTIPVRAVPVVGAVIGLAAGLVAFGVSNGVAMINERRKCENSACGHCKADHVIEQIQRTKVSQEKENIDEEMKKNYEAVVSKKSDANIKLLMGRQKVMSRSKRLAQDTVQLLYHGKRIHELTEEGFDYKKDINCNLDGIPFEDTHSTVEVVAQKNIIFRLKEAMKQLDLCTTGQISGNHRFVEEMLSGITEFTRSQCRSKQLLNKGQVKTM